MQLRHPNILAFKDSIEVQEKGQQVLYLVTEAVRPLSTVLRELNLTGKHRQVLLLFSLPYQQTDQVGHVGSGSGFCSCTGARAVTAAGRPSQPA